MTLLHPDRRERAWRIPRGRRARGGAIALAYLLYGLLFVWLHTTFDETVMDLAALPAALAGLLLGPLAGAAAGVLSIALNWALQVSLAGHSEGLGLLRDLAPPGVVATALGSGSGWSQRLRARLKERAHAAERQVALYEAMHKAAGDVGEATVLADAQGFVYMNDGLATITGYTSAELQARGSLERLVVDEERERFLARIHAPNRDCERFETAIQCKDGQRVEAEVACQPFREDGRSRVLPVVRDISERVRAQRNAEHRSLHDDLCGLPNRVLLDERLGQALRSAAREGGQLALLMIDLDRFKDVNDTFGHQVGDRLLVEVAARLRAAVRDTDTVARLGGDEFAVLLEGTGPAGAKAVGHKIVEAVARALVIDGQTLHVEASVGVALYPEHGQDGDQLLRRADIAMYVAKRAGDGYVVYDAGQDDHHAEQLSLLGSLPGAIEHDELVLHYQPQVSFATGKVVGVEALVRWQHPVLGLLPPSAFVPLTEGTSLVRALARWVIETAWRETETWRRAQPGLEVAVNVSARSLGDPDLFETIGRLPSSDGPAGLCLEITESAIVANVQRSVAALERLHEMGVRTAIDDLGTGGSSLSRVASLPVDQLKIDRSFVAEMVAGERHRALVRAAVDLGHGLGLEVLAEGVEDQPTWDLLRSLGCDAAQGYLISRPLPRDAFERWRAAHGADVRTGDARIAALGPVRGAS